MPKIPNPLPHLASLAKEVLRAEYKTDAGRINAYAMAFGVIIVAVMGAGDLFVKVWHSIHPSAPAPDGTLQTVGLFFVFSILCIAMVMAVEKSKK